MYKATAAGHALHPHLVLVPGGLLPFSAVMDTMHAATGEQKYADAARLAMVGGLVGGLAAGAAGAVDYYSIPSGTNVKRTAYMHAIMNIGILVLYALNLWTRRDWREPGPAIVALNVVSAAALVVSAWYGAKMSYEQGMRVKGVDPVSWAKDLKPPGDEALVEVFEGLETVASPHGPASSEANAQLEAAKDNQPAEVPAPS